MVKKSSKKGKKRPDRRGSQEAQKQEHTKCRTKASRKRIGYGVSLLVLAGVAFGIYQLTSRDPLGRLLASQGHRHISEAQARIPFPYNSDPPTSGPHLPFIAPWGVHRAPLPKALQIHNLEDGGVIVQYRCQDCPDLIQKIEVIVKRYPEFVIAAPYPDMEPLIALTAWRRIEELEAFDEKLIVDYIEAYHGIDNHRRR
jgi:hypothetical protein